MANDLRIPSRAQVVNLVSDDEEEHINASASRNNKTVRLHNEHVAEPRHAEVLREVFAIFPDICPEYALQLYNEALPAARHQNAVVMRIVDDLDAGRPYRKMAVIVPTPKRKRSVSDEDETRRKYSVRNPNVHDDAQYQKYSLEVLEAEFPRTPKSFLNNAWYMSPRLLLPAYQILEETERTLSATERPPYKMLKRPRKGSRRFQPNIVEATLSNNQCPPGRAAALRELTAARQLRQKAEEERERVKAAEAVEAENLAEAERTGSMAECGCCFTDYPLNRMVHCDDDQVPHWFCLECARGYAEAQIGDSRHKLHCMSTDTCSAGFSLEQKSIFLDEASILALDRLEFEANVREANIESLESCPFCPYSEEYPPKEEQKEFRCRHPDCLKKSCRLCGKDSHIPLSCAEVSKKDGGNRRQIEEAMSLALIRKCNKCQSPFVKIEGCNKMTCPKCANVQCYLCSQNADYSHFNEVSRGGKADNCRLFDLDLAKLHDEAVAQAGKEARAKVLAEHPGLAEADLLLELSNCAAVKV